ncbi:MAG: hypothetical protein SR2Q5_04285 [Quinella sp. 2Q5]|nr:hypothetical protein [Quinella sp. 2Q5]
MTTAELIDRLEKVHAERKMESHHDMLFQSYPDIEALDAVINLVKFLDGKRPSDTVTVAELLVQLTAPRMP